MRRNLIAAVLGLALCPLLHAQQTLTNDSVIKLAKAGLSDDLIISTINASPSTFSTSADSLIDLKKAGVSDKVIAAIVQKNAEPAPATAQPPAPSAPLADGQAAPAPAANNEPRVFLTSQSKGLNRNADRDQSMEMSKDFEKDCPGVKITILQNAADYTVLLNHIEVGLLIRDNQFQVANRDGDLISKTKEGGSIDQGVKKACTAIMNDWSTKH